MTKMFFTNEKTGRRYEIVRFDKESGEVVLKGELAEFAEPYDKERFQKLGYVLQKGDQDDAVR